MQTALATLAAFLGFAASIFFVLGAIRLNGHLIHQLASPKWDFHAEIARYLVGQKAEYTCGAALLLIAFVAQAISLAPFEFNQVVLFFTGQLGFLIVAVLAVAVWLVSVIVCRRHSKATIAFVERLDQEAQERQEQQLRQKKSNLYL